MKDRADLVSGWLRKADNDLRTLAAAIQVEAYDTACFHAQQAAEKALKSYLIHAAVEYPFTHNLTKLAVLCAETDPAFSSLLDTVEPLTPFAVELRYDAEFWPELEDALDAQHRAEAVLNAVREKIRTPDAG